MTSNTSNTFDLPFRRSVPLSLSNAIKNYISSKYDQHPDMFRVDLATIDALRNDAINVLEPHVSGLTKLGRYAAQLRFMSGKFPIDIGADFTWYPALGYDTQRPITQNNLQFELANILYNLASLYSRLASTSPRDTTDGLKAAHNYFACAAGVLQHLKNEVMPDLRSTPPEDMNTVTLDTLEQIMLAEAQECFWKKAVIDGNSDKVVAKLAAQTSEYYKVAGQLGIRSEAITSEWIHRLSAKEHHFASAAQFRQACDCLESSKYGEEIARLKSAIEHVDYALIEAKYLNPTYVSDLRGLKQKLQENLKRADKDNDVIYLVPVPPASSLTPVSKINLTKAALPKEIADATKMLTENGGTPLFSKLVPFAVHTAASIYSEKRDRLVTNNIVSELEALTTKLHDLLQSLNLPGALQALEKPLGIPSTLVAHAEEVRQQDGIDRVLRSIDDIAKLKANCTGMYADSVETLRLEEEADNAARAKHGLIRWTRPASREAGAGLYKKAEEYQGYLGSAAQSDELVKQKVAENEHALRILGGSPHQLESFVPNSQRVKMTAKVEREVGKLRSVLDEISRLESRRRKKIDSIREKARGDDITSEILAETATIERINPGVRIEPALFDPLFTSRLARLYDPDLSAVAAENTEQSSLTVRLTDAHAAFMGSRKSDTSTREREAALQALENAYFKYREIVGNLDTGRTFYNDLSRLLAKYRDEVKEWAYGRMQEARQMEADLEAGPGVGEGTHARGLVRPATPPQQQQQEFEWGKQSLPVGGAPPQQSHHHHHHHQQSSSGLHSPPPQSSSPKVVPVDWSRVNNNTTPLPAPQAQTRMPVPGLWNGDASTPIKFGGPPPAKGGRK